MCLIEADVPRSVVSKSFFYIPKKGGARRQQSWRKINSFGGQNGAKIEEILSFESYLIDYLFGFSLEMAN
jgi:hypothetical protein